MKKALLAISAFALPVFAFAATAQSFNTLLVKFNSILNAIIPFIIAIAVVFFIWGVFQYMIAGDEDKKKEAKGMILYGIIGIFVMVSVYGLVNILVRTLDLENSIIPGTIPTVPTRANNSGASNTQLGA